MQQYYSNVVGIIVLRRSTIVGNCINNGKKKTTIRNNRKLNEKTIFIYFKNIVVYLKVIINPET